MRGWREKAINIFFIAVLISLSYDVLRVILRDVKDSYSDFLFNFSLRPVCLRRAAVGRWHRFSLKRQTLPPLRPHLPPRLHPLNANSASLFGGLSAAAQGAAVPPPTLLPPRARCLTERLNCGLQVGSHMSGLESCASPCGATEVKTRRACRMAS